MLLGLAALVLARAAHGGDLAQAKAAGRLRILVTSDEASEMFALTPLEKPGFERELLEGFARLHRLKLDVVAIDRFE